MQNSRGFSLGNSQASRRGFLQGTFAVGASGFLQKSGVTSLSPGKSEPALAEFSYEQVDVREPLAVAQRMNVTDVLLGLDEDSLLKPFREMAGLPGPGTSLGGWYAWKEDYNFHHDDVGLAPAATFGQWVSALARLYACSKFDGADGRHEIAARVVRLNGLLNDTIAPGYFARTRFPGYSFDKLLCGLIDAHQWAGDRDALSIAAKMTAAAEPSLPGRAIDREIQCKLGRDASWMWDETYTLPENLYIAASRGAGSSYHQMAQAYLADQTYFQPLAHGINVLSDKHAYSYVNALCSAMQAYFVDGSAMHLEAVRAGFAMLSEQSFATGGWGPDELLRKPGYDELAKSLVASHNSFETPCGSYAHMKLTRYLLRATRDGSYGDSMERIMLNTVMGALPLQADGRSFYYADYNFVGKRMYSVHRWPCCSGTLPQVVADYGINGYFSEPGAVWVNLYQRSELRCRIDAQTIILEQTGSYLDDGNVLIRISTSAPASFALRLRIPAWAQDNFKLQVNSHAANVYPERGFASLERVWRTGDIVRAQFPMKLRLEALPANGSPTHEKTVALLRGPLVLFALRDPGESGWVSMERQALLSAQRTGASEWLATSQSGPRRFVPFTELGDREYSTYLKLI